jgi:hypothetical protein
MVRCTAITLLGRRCKQICKEELCLVHTPPDTCGICLGSVNNFIKLDCGHKYCGDCINEWICSLKSQTCPTCRSEVSKKICDEAYEWGLENFKCVIGTHYVLDLSILESDLPFIRFLKSQVNVNENDMLKIREIIKNSTDTYIGLKNSWNNMWMSIKAKKVLLINESRKKPDKPCVFYTFI